jgi:Zn-dependent peptidase ImmA (M78 family)
MGERYDPWRDLAQRTDLTFVVTRLPVGEAWYFHDIRGIAIDDRLDKVRRRCALAHELAHIDLGHHTQTAGCGAGTSRIARRREVHADQLAAERLITVDDLAEAFRWVHVVGPEEAAAELGVTTELVKRRVKTLTAEEKAYIEARQWGRTA